MRTIPVARSSSRSRHFLGIRGAFTIAVAISLLVAATPQTRASSPPSSDQGIAAAAAALLPRMIEIRRDLHMHPELSNREERTARVVAERLRAIQGIEVRTGVARHGVVGMLRGGKPGPVVALRADLDALPIVETNDVPYKSLNEGVKHACGHDAHTSMLIGAAEVLSGMRAELAGTVVFLFQPAEEGPPEGEPGGAPQMIEDGALSSPKVEAIFGLHVTPEFESGTVHVNSGAVMASADKFTITIKGKSAHGANPHDSVDPIVVAAACVQALQTIRSRRVNPQEGFVLSVGSVHGGSRFNIIANEVVMVGTIRTHSETTRANAVRWMREILGGVASAHGATFEMTMSESAAVTVNDPALVAATLPALKRTFGESRVLAMKPVMVAEDFSYYQREVPGVFYFLGVRDESKGFTAPLHTAAFDLDESAMVQGVRLLVTSATDYLERAAKR